MHGKLINAILGYLTKYRWVAPRGTASMTMLADLLEDGEMAGSLPEVLANKMARMVWALRTRKEEYRALAAVMA